MGDDDVLIGGDASLNCATGASRRHKRGESLAQGHVNSILLYIYQPICHGPAVDVVKKSMASQPVAFQVRPSVMRRKVLEAVLCSCGARASPW